jgi:hypothetical protein
MSRESWTDIERDQVYSELCEAVTRVGTAQEALYLSRLCLLLIEKLGSREQAVQAITDAQQGLLEQG